jgi:hypothetical protein
MVRSSLSPRRHGVQMRDLTPEQRADLERLRAIAMAIAERILEMLPRNETAAEPAKAEPDSAQTDTAERASTQSDSAKPDSKGANLLPAEFDRLLGRSDGIVDSLERLAKIVIRIIDKEREYSESAAAYTNVPRMDEAELDRRIAAELDFIAEQRRAAGLSEAA